MKKTKTKPTEQAVAQKAEGQKITVAAVNDKAARLGLDLRHRGGLFVLAHVGLTLQQANDLLDRLAQLKIEDDEDAERDAERDAENEGVLQALRCDYPKAADWNCDVDKVEIFDKRGKLLATISDDHFDRMYLV